MFCITGEKQKATFDPRLLDKNMKMMQMMAKNNSMAAMMFQGKPQMPNMPNMNPFMMQNNLQMMAMMQNNKQFQNMNMQMMQAMLMMNQAQMMNNPNFKPTNMPAGFPLNNRAPPNANPSN